jgi:hypothetical protein
MIKKIYYSHIIKNNLMLYYKKIILFRRIYELIIGIILNIFNNILFKINE